MPHHTAIYLCRQCSAIKIPKCADYFDDDRLKIPSPLQEKSAGNQRHSLWRWRGLSSEGPEAGSTNVHVQYGDQKRFQERAPLTRLGNFGPLATLEWLSGVPAPQNTIVLRTNECRSATYVLAILLDVQDLGLPKSNSSCRISTLIAPSALGTTYGSRNFGMKK